MRFLIVSLLLSIAGVTFSANDDDGDTIVNRNERMSIMAEADAAKATTEEPSSDNDEESTADPSSDSGDKSSSNPSSDSDNKSTANPSSDSDDESTADPSSDSDEEGTANPSSDSDDDDKSSSDSDQEDEGLLGISEISEGCPCGCPKNLVSPPICMRFWLNNPDFGAIGRAGNQCVYNCYKCRAARVGFKFKRVKPTSIKTCPGNTDNSKQCLRILRRVVLFQTQMPRRHNGGDPLGASRFQETQRRQMLQSSQHLLPRLHQQGLQRRLYLKC